VSEAITGQTVAISQRTDGHWLIRFADVALGIIDRSSGELVRLGAGRPPRAQAHTQA
jgi:putative transposase